LSDTTAIKQPVFQGFYADLCGQSWWEIPTATGQPCSSWRTEMPLQVRGVLYCEVRVIPFLSLILIMIVYKETIKINYALGYAYIDGSFNDASSEYEELNSRMIVR
jgi:hypothetical protein